MHQLLVGKTSIACSMLTGLQVFEACIAICLNEVTQLKSSDDTFSFSIVHFHSIYHL